jgi:hypothetical protein
MTLLEWPTRHDLRYYAAFTPTLTRRSATRRNARCWTQPSERRQLLGSSRRSVVVTNAHVQHPACCPTGTSRASETVDICARINARRAERQHRIRDRCNDDGVCCRVRTSSRRWPRRLLRLMISRRHADALDYANQTIQRDRRRRAAILTCESHLRTPGVTGQTGIRRHWTNWNDCDSATRACGDRALRATRRAQLRQLRNRTNATALRAHVIHAVSCDKRNHV